MGRLTMVTVSCARGASGSAVCQISDIRHDYRECGWKEWKLSVARRYVSLVEDLLLLRAEG